MEPISPFKSGKVKPIPKRSRSDSTAMQIFKKDYLHPFLVSRIHFKMNNGTYRFPSAFSGSRKEEKNFNMGLVSTMGTIIQMSDYFRDGAVISIPDPKVAKVVYQTILKHLEAHLYAMQTRKDYVPPEDDTLRELSEFATAIRYKALEEDPDVDDLKTTSGFLNQVAAREKFITFNKGEIEVERTEVIPKSIQKMDAIERYLNILGG